MAHRIEVGLQSAVRDAWGEKIKRRVWEDLHLRVDTVSGIDVYTLDLEVTNYFAEVEGIAMTDQHWEVVNFLRDYYKQYQIAPMIKILVKEIGKKLGPDKGNTKYLYELYPGGPAKQACKIAGLPKPTGCG